MTKEEQVLQDKIFKANSNDRKTNTEKLLQKLDELKPKDFPELPKFPDQIEVKLAGVELLKGEKGDQGEKGEQGEPGRDGKDGLDGQDGLNGPPGENGKDGKDGRDGIDGKDGKDGSPDTPEQIVEKLKTLEKAWLDVKAIAGLDEFMRQFGAGFLDQAKAFAPRALASLYDVDVHNISDQQSLIWDATKRKFVPGSSTGSGLTKLTATGTVDGSNTAFTFTSKPTYVVSDGAWYVENSGWTWSGSTATLSVPPQTGIWGFS